MTGAVRACIAVVIVGAIASNSDLTASPTPGVPSITGIVFDQELRPLADVRVTWRPSETVVATSGETHSDGQGRFEVAPADDGDLGLVFEHAAFAVAGRSRVRPGAHLEVTLEAGVAVHGVVRSTIDDEPRSAWLRVQRSEFDNGDTFVIRTGADGAFAFAVPAGTARLDVGADDHVPQSWLPFDVSTAPRPFDIRLSPPALSDWIYVRVVDSVTRAPIRDALLTPAPASEVEPGLYRTRGRIQATSAVIAIAAPGYTSSSQLVSFGGSRAPTTPIEVSLTRSSIVVPPTKTLDRGTPTDTPIDVAHETGVSLTGRVVDMLGRPAPNACVRCRLNARRDPDDPHGLRLRERFVHAGADGTFKFTGLTPGAYYVFVSLDFSRVPSRQIDVEGASTVMPDLVLEPMTGITGRVVGASSRAPIAQFEVCGRNSGNGSGPEWMSRAIENGNGRFFMHGAIGTPFCVTVSAFGFTPQTSRSIVLAKGELRDMEFVLQDPTELRGLVVDGAGDAIGQCLVQLDAGDGEGTGEHSAWTDADGEFRFLCVPPEDYPVRVTRVDTSDATEVHWTAPVEPETVRIDFGAPQRTTLRAVAQPGSRVDIGLDGRDGCLDDVQRVVLALRPEGKFSSKDSATVTIIRGRSATIPFLAEGNYDVRATIDRLRDGRSETVHLACEPASFEIEDEPLQTVLIALSFKN